MVQQFILYESASGYGLFEVVEAEEIGALLPQVQKAVLDLAHFSKIVKLKAFSPFTTAENALENINHVSEASLSDDLKAFLELNLPKVKPGKEAKFILGVVDVKIGSAIQEGTGLPCNSNETVLEIIRGIRLHFGSFVKGLADGNLEKAQLGLGHSYSRAKVKFNVNRSDNMIIQSISLLDQLDKDLNTFAMRIKEWYSWHFPELARIVKDSYVYARVAKYIGSRGTFAEDKLPGLTEITLDEAVSQQILDAARSSMGMDTSDIDMINIDSFATRLISLAEYRRNLSEYMSSKMSQVAPNLGALIGEPVAARLISHAGSLTNLAKCPASTVQILGAEKALFRALKSKGNTPKYGLIFHSTFIGRAGTKNKGRVSRYLANKCSIAARMDAFSEVVTNKYGEALRDQVEERLKFFESGDTPRKNADVMAEVSSKLKASAPTAAAADKPKKDKKDKKSKKDKKRPLEEEEEAPAAAAAAAEEEDEAPKAKKDKKEKKAKKSKAE